MQVIISFIFIYDTGTSKSKAVDAHADNQEPTAIYH
jgi:hypothetical protein